MRKLVALAVLLASTFAAIVAPSAQAVATCGSSYCTGRPSSSTCACPSNTPFAGATATCGTWIVDCYPVIDPCYECQ
jgi:hypothetical protein